MTCGPQRHSVVAIYDSHDGAEAGVKALQRAGLDLRQLSIVGKGFHAEEHALGFYTTGDRMKSWAGRGALWGSLGEMLVGNALFFIPSWGPIVVMGPLVRWMVGVLEGAALGGAAGALAGALVSIGIAKDSIAKYGWELKAGKFLVLAHGTAGFIEEARTVLGTSGASLVKVHPNRSAARDRCLLPAHPESTKDETRRAEQVTSEAILDLLSDEEIARVCTAETAVRLTDGDEYLDLEQLDEGVRRTLGAVTMGSILPRSAVHETTWSKILNRLAPLSVATHPAP